MEGEDTLDRVQSFFSDNQILDMDFCTLGMFIIDDIYPSPSDPDQTPKKDVVGGAGTYSAIGARLLSQPPLSKKVGWIVDAGTDFAPELRDIISSWDTGVLMRRRPSLTTRGWNGYSDNQHRAFKYLTDKKRITAEDLTKELYHAKSFHLICSAERCKDLVQQIRHKVTTSTFTHSTVSSRAPRFIWEPVPDLAVASELDNVKEALRSVHVISPNHEELAALFGFEHPASGIDKTALEAQAQELVDHGIGLCKDGAIVVRAGKEGCYIAQNHSPESTSPNSKTISKWLPAYHTDPAMVVDPTGGGNGFLGGFAVGLVRSGGDVVEAAIWGSVAASFCIEQVGVPVLARGIEGEDERWNGANVEERVGDFRRRVDESSGS